MQLVCCCIEVEPSGSVDFGEELRLARPWRPLELDHAAMGVVGPDCVSIEVSFDSERMQPLLARSERIKHEQVSVRGRLPDLLIELPTCGSLGRFVVRVEFALGD